MSIFKSRKFWIMVADAVFSLAATALAWFFAPTVVDRVLAVLAILQPVVYAVIKGIAVEDAAEKSARVYYIDEE